MMMKKLIALLVCILLLATAQAEAPADTSAAETTEYGWTLKIGRMAARGMPIQDLLNTLAAQDCPAVFAVGGWTGFMESRAAAALTAKNIASAVPNWKVGNMMLSSANESGGFFYVDLEDYVSPEDAFDTFEFNIIKLQ